MSAAAELTALATSTVTALLLYGLTDLSYQTKLMVVVSLSTAAWVTVARWGPQTADQVLDAFYRRVRPGGPGWGAVRRNMSVQRRGRTALNFRINK